MQNPIMLVYEVSKLSEQYTILLTYHIISPLNLYHKDFLLLVELDFRF